MHPALTALLLSPAARAAPLPGLLDEVCALLRGTCGLPIDRASWSVPTLHPDIRAHQLVWTPGGGAVEIARRWGGAAGVFSRSPLAVLYAGDAVELWLPIAPGPGPRAYELLDELAEQGFTDYFVAVIGEAPKLERGPVSWATRQPGGFTAEQIDALRSILPLLSLVILAHALRRRTHGLLQTYLGLDAAERVLAGTIRRGDVVEVEAAIAFCDLRGFTGLAARLSPAALIALLNDVFDAVVGVVDEQGGDVLKFIGDAVLVIFRVEAAGGRAEAAERALRAAQGAVAAVAALASAREAAGEPGAAVGFGLHLGRVSYGNIGAHARLDFTVIGADVNLASRLEGLCPRLGVSAALSGELAAALPAAARSALSPRGEFAQKGVPAPVEVWTVEPAGPDAGGSAGA
jgi:adenylate cyclase